MNSKFNQLAMLHKYSIAIEMNDKTKQKEKKEK